MNPYYWCWVATSWSLQILSISDFLLYARGWTGSTECNQHRSADCFTRVPLGASRSSVPPCIKLKNCFFENYWAISSAILGRYFYSSSPLYIPRQWWLLDDYEWTKRNSRIKVTSLFWAYPHYTNHKKQIQHAYNTKHPQNSTSTLSFTNQTRYWNTWGHPSLREMA
jgi:hypothetical protein